MTEGAAPVAFRYARFHPMPSLRSRSAFGLSGVLFAIKGDWEKALASVVFAGVLDGMDGRIARLLRANSRFGAELD